MLIKSSFIGFAGLVLSVAALPTTFALHAAPATATVPTIDARNGAADFDFLYGRPWRVHNRRLQQRMVGSTSWVEFDAKDVFEPLPGGIGNEEHYRTDYWKDYVGIGLHMYDRNAAAWSLYWIDNHAMPGVLQPPVRGRFANGIGIFEGADEFNGKPVTVRFIWKSIDKDHATWEQAFSSDGGTSWETNWSMDFTR
jgi:hypothetical protein